jgi:hypothetical protein
MDEEQISIVQRVTEVIEFANERDILIAAISLYPEDRAAFRFAVGGMVDLFTFVDDDRPPAPEAKLPLGFEAT